MTRFVRVIIPPHTGYNPAWLRWRVLEVDRAWSRIEMPSLADCHRLLNVWLGDQLGRDVHIVLVDGDSDHDIQSRLHPNVVHAYKAAAAADALQGIQ